MQDCIALHWHADYPDTIFEYLKSGQRALKYGAKTPRVRGQTIQDLHVEVPKLHRVGAHKHTGSGIYGGSCWAVLTGDHALADAVHVEAPIEDLPMCKQANNNDSYELD